MIKLSVGDFLSDKLGTFDNLGLHFIYVFRDGDTVLYVGRSEDIEARLWEHIGPLPGYPYYGRFYRGPSIVGKLIMAKSPESLFWEIELLTFEDCRSLVPSIPENIKERLLFEYYGQVEIEMIRYFSPVLNSSHNPTREGNEKYMLPHPKGFDEAYNRIFNNSNTSDEDRRREHSKIFDKRGDNPK